MILPSKLPRIDLERRQVVPMTRYEEAKMLLRILLDLLPLFNEYLLVTMLPCSINSRLLSLSLLFNPKLYDVS